jgi:hypothetical protein
MIRSPLRLFVLALTAVLAALVLPATAQAAPYCGITWGSQLKTTGNNAPGTYGSSLTEVRSGRHECYDRLVLTISGDTTANSYRVQYVSQVQADGSGFVVPLRGGAFLQITVGADNTGVTNTSRRELTNVTGYTTFRQVAGAGGFEGYSSVGLGVRALLPFRVLTVTGPGNAVRVVIDVAHRW